MVLVKLPSRGHLLDLNQNLINAYKITIGKATKTSQKGVMIGESF